MKREPKTFIMENCPHLMEPLRMLNPNSEVEELTLYKSSACGATESPLSASWNDLFDFIKSVEDHNKYIHRVENVKKHMDDLKQKYPNWSDK